MTKSKPAAGKTGRDEKTTRDQKTRAETEVADAGADVAGNGAEDVEAQGAAAGAGESLAEVSVEDLQQQLTDALAQVAEYKDLALRAEAEMQNVRRRVARDVENAHKFGTERFLVGLLPVVDSLERAVEAASEDEEANKAILEGMEICLKMLTDSLAKEHVVQLDPLGEPFDPDFHEAIQMVERDDMEPNSVAMVIQKGYTLNGRVVRPAMVIVSREAAAKSEEESKE